jgi:predicted GNAT superfamily acetyltransferase
MNSALIQAQNNSNNLKITKSITKMDISKLNPVVKNAFEAWQKGDSHMFLSYFTSDVKLFDDDHPRDFMKFVKEACGHEKFTSIDKVEGNGLDIYGDFHTERWGDFKTYFKFQINTDEKIYRLDIGQAKN